MRQACWQPAISPPHLVSRWKGGESALLGEVARGLRLVKPPLDLVIDELHKGVVLKKKKKKIMHKLRSKIVADPVTGTPALKIKNIHNN